MPPQLHTHTYTHAHEGKKLQKRARLPARHRDCNRLRHRTGANATSLARPPGVTTSERFLSPGGHRVPPAPRPEDHLQLG